MIKRIVITNHTDSNIILHSMTFENSSYIKPSVYVNGAKKGSAQETNYIPEVLVKSFGNGNVTKDNTGIIPNFDGSVSFIWEDNGKENYEGGSLIGSGYAISTNLEYGKITPIWAHKLVVQGAKTIGSQTASLKVWLFGIEDDKKAIDQGLLDVQASGDIFLSLIGAKRIMVKLDDADLTKVDPETKVIGIRTDKLDATTGQYVNVNGIHSNLGNVDLELGSMLRKTTEQEKRQTTWQCLPGSVVMEPMVRMMSLMQISS